VDHLNKDLASELAAIVQFLVYAAKATGPYRPQLTAFYLSEVADEQLHAQYLADKIVAMGGEPTTEASKVPAAATNKEMLEAVLTAEQQATRGYT
jgi:bacterioferritin